MKLQAKLSIILIIAIAVLSYFFYFRIDLTSDKHYSITTQTKELLKTTESTVKITIYLDGDLNPGFLRLKKATKELLDEMSVYSNNSFEIDFENPSLAENQDERQKKYSELEALGMTATAIYERDREGKAIQKTVFPWAKINYNGKTAFINLLKNIKGNSGEANLNISIENLEFEITDGLRRLMIKSVSKIAFIEGHGELNEAESYDISKTLSRYFQIDRGKLANDASILNDYKAIIIAKPTQPFSESDKFILDQYLMNGGKIIWFIDGARIATENLSTTGLTPAMELDLNLTDLFFKYGIRINPGILQDVQCATIPINIAPANAPAQFEPSPWYFGALLLTSEQHAITKNITEVRSEFASTIELVGDNKNSKPSLLLASSDNSHIIETPATIDLKEMPDAKDKAYFNAAYLPVAVLVEGEFNSNFENRIIPKEITNRLPFRAKSVSTKQIFVSDGDIIRNETNGIASDSTTLPLGFDRYMNQQFGNKDFVQNAILYITDDASWINLRSRSIKLRLLNKNQATDERLFWQIMNIALPILLLLIFAIAYQIIRKKKYTK